MSLADQHKPVHAFRTGAAVVAGGALVVAGGAAIAGAVGGAAAINSAVAGVGATEVSSAALFTGRAAAILMSAGKAIGVAGNSKGVRVVKGGVDDARQLASRLSQGCEKIFDSAERVTWKTPTGGHITFRPNSKSGGPVIDINFSSPKIGFDKIHFK